MQAIREERDSDRLESYSRQSEVETITHRNEVVCGSCARILFVDDETINNLARALEAEQDNQFMCDECSEELQDQAFAR